MAGTPTDTATEAEASATPAIAFLPPRADNAEVCAWLAALDGGLARYFAAVFHSCIDGRAVYSDDMDGLLTRLAVPAASPHHTMLKEVGKGIGGKSEWVVFVNETHQLQTTHAHAKHTGLSRAALEVRQALNN